MLKIIAKCAVKTIIAAFLVFLLNLFINVPMGIDYYVKYSVLLFIFITIIELARKYVADKKK
jgi:hypothetical protein